MRQSLPYFIQPVVAKTLTTDMGAEPEAEDVQAGLPLSAVSGHSATALTADPRRSPQKAKKASSRR
jgi:hypothetical protein